MELFEFKDGVMQRRDIYSTEIKFNDVVEGPFVIKFTDRDMPVYYVGNDDFLHTFMQQSKKLYFHIQSVVGTVNFLASMRGIHVLDTDNSTMRDFMQLLREVTR